MPELFFEAPETAANPYWVLRIIHYPTLPSNTVRAFFMLPPALPGTALTPGGGTFPQPGLSCGEHCDYGLLTLGVMT